MVEENIDTVEPSYTFTETGDYKLSVKIKATGCSKAYVEEEITITVISDNLFVLIV